MYAIVDIAGKQYKITEEEQITIPKVDVEIGEKVELDRVLLVSSDDDVKIGQPVLESASVNANVLEHGRDDKVVVFKKKRRKNYRVKKGHRQSYTKIQIEKINA